MHDLTQNALPFIEHFSGYAALFAFAAALGETLIGLGWLLPGSTILLTMGVLAGQGVLDISTVMGFGILGAWLGDSLNYHLGKKYGTEFLRSPRFHLPESMIGRAHIFLDSHGAKSVFFSRFLPGLKETVPFLAGSVRMDRRKFLIWNLLGAVGWGLEFIGTGYLFSSSLALAQTWMERGSIVVAVLVGIGLFLWLVKRFLQANLPVARAILAGMGQGVLHSRPIQRFIVRHPNVVAWVTRRSDWSRFSGFPLTVLVLVFGYVLLLFGGVAEDFLTQDPIIHVDHIVANLMAQWRTLGLIGFFTWVTYLGREPVVVAVFLTGVALLALYRRYDDAIALVVSVTGSIFFLGIGKLAFHRPRPDIALYFEPTWSFPSGHATIAVSLYGFFGYLLIHYAPTLRAKLNLFYLTTLLILGIGFSRIYLGEHYLSDVYAGWLLGTLWVIVGVTVLRWMQSRDFFPERTPRVHSRLLAGFIVTVVSIASVAYLVKVPYRPAPHPASSPILLTSLPDYFSRQDNRFTRNLLGLQSRPVTLLITSKHNPCTALTGQGWRPLSEINTAEAPLFYHAREPLCRLGKQEASRLDLLDIWQPDLRYDGIPLYLGAVDALTGRRWGALPRYLSDPSEVRNVVTRDFAGKQTRTLQLASPAIRTHFDGQEYFDDGKSVWIKGAK